MSKKNKLLSVLSDAEQEALYGLPEFTYRKLKNQSIPLSTPYAT